MDPAVRTFLAGEQIFCENDPSDCMYLVRKGTVSIRKGKNNSGSSGSVEIAKVYTNEVLGELSFFDRRPRSATAIAMTEVEVLEIGFEKLDKIYSQIPDYLKTIMAAVAERLRKANDTIRRLNREFGGKATSDEDEPASEIVEPKPGDVDANVAADLDAALNISTDPAKK